MPFHRRMLVGSRFPVVTTVLIGACLVGFIVELFQGRALGEFLLRFGVVPVGLVSYFLDVSGASVTRSVLPFFSSLFLHGGYLHLLVNVSFLWIVGDVVEDALGRTRYVVLFLFGAAAELIVRIGVSPEPSSIPSVGASGAVAALVGGYVVVLSWLWRGGQEKGDSPLDSAKGTVPFARPGAGLPLSGRVSLLLGGLAWFPLQILNRSLALAPTCQTEEPVPWLALAASFAMGVFLVALSGPRRSASTPSEAVAFPNEETAPLQA